MHEDFKLDITEMNQADSRDPDGIDSIVWCTPGCITSADLLPVCTYSCKICV